MKNPKLSHSDAHALRRELVGPVKLREIGQARERYEADLRSRWDSYEGAIAAAEGIPDPFGDDERAREPNPDRLVDLLRARRKPLADGDRVRLRVYISKKLRPKFWRPWLEDALRRTPTEEHALGRPTAEEQSPLSRIPTEEQYDLLADLIATVGRKPHRVADAPVHRAARLARVMLSIGPKRIHARLRTAVIDLACTIEGDESGVEIDPERVRNVLDHPGARDTKR